ncbi:MAG: hypothetical protein WD003_01120 [Candidatus Paceibacterota bacterium]
MRFRNSEMERLRRSLKRKGDGELVDYALTCARRYQKRVTKISELKKGSPILWREARGYHVCYYEIKRELERRGCIIGEIVERNLPSPKLRLI